MWLINWYKKNKAYVNTVLVSAGTIGMVASALCLLFPVSLTFLASMTLFGGAPFTFLATLPLLLSSSLVGVIASVFSGMGMALGIAVTKQGQLFARHFSTLFANKEKLEPFEAIDDSYKKLLHSSLHSRSARYRKEREIDREEFEVPNSLGKGPQNNTTQLSRVNDTSLQPAPGISTLGLSL